MKGVFFVAFLDLFKTSNKQSKPVPQKEKTVSKKEKTIPQRVFEAVQTKGYKGYKTVYMTTYNGEDRTCYRNAQKLREKYGDDFIGATISISKVQYSTSPTSTDGQGQFLLCVEADGLKVGVIFDTSDDYRRIMQGKVLGAYCKVKEETVINKEGEDIRVKAVLLLKFE